MCGFFIIKQLSKNKSLPIFDHFTTTWLFQRLQGLRIGRSETFASAFAPSRQVHGACRRKGHICILPYSKLTVKGVIHDNCMVSRQWGYGGPPPENFENLIFKWCKVGHFSVSKTFRPSWPDLCINDLDDIKGPNMCTQII